MRPIRMPGGSDLSLGEWSRDDNSLFTLETNGTLRSAVTFDYESNASSMPSAYKSRTSITPRLRQLYGPFAGRERGHSEQPTKWTEFDWNAFGLREQGGRYGGWGIHCDRSGCRSDLSLGEWSRTETIPLYFGDQMRLSESGCATSQGRA